MVAAPHERADAAKQSFTITIRGESRTLFPNNISIQQRMQIRAQTKHPLTVWVDEIDLDSVAVLWWAAAIQEGARPSYSFAESLVDWPDDVTPDEIDVVQDDGTTPADEVSPEG